MTPLLTPQTEGKPTEEVLTALENFIRGIVRDELSKSNIPSEEASAQPAFISEAPDESFSEDSEARIVEEAKKFSQSAPEPSISNQASTQVPTGVSKDPNPKSAAWGVLDRIRAKKRTGS